MIKRTLYKELKKHLTKPEISFIVGPRQSGKTTLMLLLKDELEKKGERVLYLNLDIENDKRFFISQEKLLQKINLEIGKSKGFVFIDEIQRKENAGIFLKGLYDMKLPYKFIVSGSGSVDLKEKIKESLFGRKRIFNLNTLSFSEFLNYKTNYRYEDNLLDFLRLEKEKTELLLYEYLIFGGYPRVVIESEKEEKIKLLNEIYQSYIEKDVFYLLKVKKTEAFLNLFKILSSQIGKIINYSELSSTVGISFLTLKEYLFYLEKTFIVEKLSPFYTNIRKELTKAPIYYFKDGGIRNFSISDFSENVADGFLFQNFIFNILKEKCENTATKINFWRSKDGAEVDFILNSGKSIIPIEVKFQKLKRTKINTSLRNFIKRYNPKRVFVVNLDLNESIKIDETQINFLPYYELICRDF